MLLSKSIENINHIIFFIFSWLSWIFSKGGNKESYGQKRIIALVDRISVKKWTNEAVNFWTDQAVTNNNGALICMCI
jgi:hypothetical protein